MNLLKFLRFGFSGGIAFLSQLAFLYFFYKQTHLELVFSSVLAYFLSFIISFCLQKFWAFRETSKKRTYKQFPLYLALGAFNVFVDAQLIDLLANDWGIHYLLSQIMIMSSMGIYNFILYNYVIFKPQKV